MESLAEASDRWGAASEDVLQLLSKESTKKATLGAVKNYQLWQFHIFNDKTFIELVTKIKLCVWGCNGSSCCCC